MTFEEERNDSNRAAIRRISFYRRIRPEFHSRVEKGNIRREETRARSDTYRNAKLTICGAYSISNCYDSEYHAEHLYDTTSFGVRIVPNAAGNGVLWVPEEVMPRYARELNKLFGMDVIVGDRYTIRNGRRDKSFPKWRFSITDELCITSDWSNSGMKLTF